jgi:serine/threonine protein kinase
MTQASTSMASFVGRTIGSNYRLQAFLAEGGFGAVYRSEQSFLDHRLRRVAVKVSKHPGVDFERLREQLADVYILAEAIDELSDAEARSHLVQIYDAGIWKQEQERAYIVMEFVQGKDLAGVFDSYRPSSRAPHSELRVPENLVRNWARQLARTLGELHSLVPAVIHRDLKPSNILLENDKHIRVVDFGLAARLMRHGYVEGNAGTTAYMAPEVSMGSGESLPASDVYSIGLILYEALTGRLPYKDLIPPTGMPAAAEVAWLYREKSKIPSLPPSHWNATVSKEMDRIVLKCLEFNTARRYFTGLDLLRDLEPPMTVARKESPRYKARGLKEQGDPAGARHLLEAAVAIPLSPNAPLVEINERFEIYCDLAEILKACGDIKGRPLPLMQAWELVKERALPNLDRVKFRSLIAEAWVEAGNKIQADRWRKS